MNNLIPEKRMDKNGRLVTKHVRAGGPTGVNKAVPPPSLNPGPKRKVKPLTKKQKNPNPFTMHNVKNRTDPKLKEALGLDQNLEAYNFIASDEEIYSVFTATNIENSLAFLQAGYTNGDDAAQFLQDNNLEHLIEDNTEIANEALQRRISAAGLLRFAKRLDTDDRDNPNFMDALEVSSMGALKTKNVYPLVLDGSVRLSDIKTVGASRLRDAGEWKTMVKTLRTLNEGSTHLTADDVAKILGTYYKQDRSINSALHLAQKYGGEMGHSLRNPPIAQRMDDSLSEQGMPEERIKSIIKYADQLRHEIIQEHGYSKEQPNEEDVIRFHDSNVNIDDVVHEQITIRHLDAIENEGITPSVAGGWL